MTNPIVLIDDDEVTNTRNLVLIRSMFPNASISMFKDGEHAIVFLQEMTKMRKSYEELVVFLDIRMGDTDGFDVLFALEDLIVDGGAPFAIYLLTSDESDGTKEKAARFPFVKQLIYKPLKKKTLRELFA